MPRPEKPEPTMAISVSVMTAYITVTYSSVT